MTQSLLLAEPQRISTSGFGPCDASEVELLHIARIWHKPYLSSLGALWAREVGLDIIEAGSSRLYRFQLLF